ncbi:cysteine synthase family protein [Microvenator marinus]|uniref:cysteine synthase n=1 Tax=Microvenator marinus TaxID=2600177 RepID=A0A5B8XMB5_9DELT|nr:cysteine synthase family protein [Microvenator marinus]QED26780.1 cysteine synthase family protein [Microvenator marinus]
MRVINDISEMVGNTPMIRLNKLFRDSPAEIYGKLELFNPMSVKDRPVKFIIDRAIAEGRIKPGAELVEASSGNTAIALAMVGAAHGFPVKIFMSELCSEERFKILNTFGATVVLTPGVEHTKGSRERAIAYCEEKPGERFFVNQHSNPNNGDAHEATTGPEIWEQLNGELDIMVIGLGTSGTFEGLSRFFKSRDRDVKIVGFEPAASPVYAGGQMGKHKLVGIGPGFVTENFERGRSRLDELYHVTDEAAFAMTKELALREGIMAGVTAGASLWVAKELAAKPENAGKKICSIICDSGERYLSVAGLFPADKVERMA